MIRNTNVNSLKLEIWAQNSLLSLKNFDYFQSFKNKNKRIERQSKYKNNEYDAFSKDNWAVSAFEFKW